MNNQEILKIINEAKNRENIVVQALRGPKPGEIEDKGLKNFYGDINNGKARFGWSGKSMHEEWIGGNAFLLRLKEGDWVVYVNTYNIEENRFERGRCVAAQVTNTYSYDKGIDAGGWYDYRHVIGIDPETVFPFYKNNPNVDRSLYWNFPGRAWRLNAAAFFRTVENITQKKYDGTDSNAQLKDMIKEQFSQMTNLIQKMNSSKKLEEFLCGVFKRMPNVVSVDWNGKGGSDDGADLIVDFDNPISELSGYKLIVQVKSYVNKINNTLAVDQVMNGIKKYDGDVGLIFVTADPTPDFDSYVIKITEEIKKPINVIAGYDVARFVLRYAPREIS